MINISFANPWLLLIAIPLLVLLIIPFILAFNKDNRSKSAVSSLILHIIITALVTLALAGTIMTTIITETNVYILADVSYSANNELDTIDTYIKGVKEKLPLNSKYGVIAFGKDQKIVSELGGEFSTVKDSGVDNTETDIVSAMNYANDLFNDGVIKKIVLLTDGRQSDPEKTAELINTVENLYKAGVSIDTVFIDSNIKEGLSEVQVNGVTYTERTYLNHEEVAEALIQSNTDVRASVYLYKGEEKIAEVARTFTKGYNFVSFSLPTDANGTNNYRIVVDAENDTSVLNNEYLFNQQVSGKIKVLLITSNDEELLGAKRLYGSDADIDGYIKYAVRVKQSQYDFNPKEVQLWCHIPLYGDNYQVPDELKNLEQSQILLQKDFNEIEKHAASQLPSTVEQLCVYDEIVLADVDISEHTNPISFIESLDTVVSQFGKTLMTVGDTKIQNKTDEILSALDSMLPVNYGNTDRDAKLYVYVMDVSRSMEYSYKLVIAKQVAINMLDLMDYGDSIAILSFAGETRTVLGVTPVPAKEDTEGRQELIDAINSVEPMQGTLIGAGLNAAYEFTKDLDMFYDKQIMLMSDGISFGGETYDPVKVTEDLFNEGVTTSCVTTSSPTGVALMDKIAAAGGGKNFQMSDPDNVEDAVFGDIADEVVETVINQDTPVKIHDENSHLVDGIDSLPNVKGYVFGKIKSSAKTILTVNYTKASDQHVEIPLYAYRGYGNGKVISFSASLGNEWMVDWVNSQSANAFLDNAIKDSIPEEKVEQPFTLSASIEGSGAEVEIVPAKFNPQAVVSLTLTRPDGSTVTENLKYSQNGYTYSFKTQDTGIYSLKIDYSYGSYTLPSVYSYVSYSYLTEHNAFTLYDAASLHEVVRTRGTVSTDGIPELKNDENKIATYEVEFGPAFMIAAIVLFVVDVIIRKIKKEDILSLLKAIKR